jgi:hypothetical protein
MQLFRTRKKSVNGAPATPVPVVDAGRYAMVPQCPARLRRPRIRAGRLLALFVLSGLISLPGFMARSVLPMFQKHCVIPPRVNAMQDMDVIRNAIFLHDQQQPERFIGPSLHQLVGRYLQELPQDPWGRPYIVSSRLGVIMCLGADGLPGGDGDDEDLVVLYPAPMTWRE